MGTLNIEKLIDLKNKVIHYLEEQIFYGKTSVENEEQTKNWLILPFLSALGYDTQSSDVVPEVTADFSKKGEKVDYMLQVNNLPVALIECKKFGEPLNKHINQLFRYFQTKNVHIGILTNGVVYQFFTDSKRENVMDKKPYFTFDISEDDLSLLNDYAKENITQASIPSIVNKRKQLEQQKEQEISNYKSQITELQEKISKQKEEPNVNEQIYSAMLFQQLLKAEKLEKENKQLKEKAKPKKEKVFYGHTDLDKQKVPADIARDMVALLPEDIFVPEAKFFDPFCRYGELLMAVKDRLMQSQAMKKAFPDEDDRDDYISDNQLYAFVIDQKGLKNVTRVIHKTSNPRESHVVCFGSEEVYKKAMKSDSKVFIVEKLKELGQMKFDVVIGNPPYNNDMYIPFVELGHRLAEKCSVFITPAKWQAKGGKDNEMFRKTIVPYMEKIIYYPDEKDVFDINCGGGISYYIIDKEIHNKKAIKNVMNKSILFNSEYEEHSEETIVLIPQNILQIIKKCADGKFHKTLGFSQSYHVKNTEHGHAEKIDGDMVLMQGEKPIGYVGKNEIIRYDNLDKYKCITSVLINNGALICNDGMAHSYLAVYKLNPNQVPKGSFPVLRYFNTSDEADSFISYCRTKLVHFLFICGLSGTTQTEAFWRFVPQPEAFDHIFTDKELYEKYNLTEEEIDIIESVTKERA